MSIATRILFAMQLTFWLGATIIAFGSFPMAQYIAEKEAAYYGTQVAEAQP